MIQLKNDSGEFIWVGVSTETKPLTPGGGGFFYEHDTEDTYIFTSAGWKLYKKGVKFEAGDLNIGNVDVVTLPAANLYPVKIHTIAIAIVNAAAIQTDFIIIDGVVCSFTSDATPTTTEISTGLRAAIAASAAAGKFVVTGTTNVVLTPAYAYSPEVTVSANLTDVQTIGAVTMLGVKAHLGAGELHVGEVGGNSLPVVVTPAIAAAAFSVNDIVGGKLTLTDAMRVPGGSGEIDSLMLVDASKQNAPLSIFVFNAALEVAGGYCDDNAACAVTVVDWKKCLGVIDILASDYKTMSLASVVSLGGIGMKVKATTGTSLYALIVTTGTPTYGANALQLTFGLGRN